MLNTNGGSALVSGAAETKNKFGVKKMAKLQKPKVGKFIVANKKNYVGDAAKKVLTHPQCWVEGEEVFAGDLLEMEVNSQDAKELVSRTIVIPVDKEAKEAYKNYEDDELVKELQAIAKQREGGSPSSSKGSK